jgi:hypothetical protein
MICTCTLPSLDETLNCSLTQMQVHVLRLLFRNKVPLISVLCSYLLHNIFILCKFFHCCLQRLTGKTLPCYNTKLIPTCENTDTTNLSIKCVIPTHACNISSVQQCQSNRMILQMIMKNRLTMIKIVTYI